MMGAMDASTTALIAFLRARLDERAQLAELISGGGYAPDVWEIDRSSVGSWSFVWAKSRTNNEPREAAVREDDNPVAIVQYGRNEDVHIAANDPDWVLADVAAKRDIIDAYELSESAKLLPGDNVFGYHAAGLLIAIRHLATVYAAHPDYREEWRP